MTRRRWTVLAFVAFAVAAAYPMQVNGWNQNAHYALVRALAHGTPTIDESRTEIGDLGTGDVTLVDGHYYSNKAPGLAFVSLPAFWVVESAGMRTTGDPTRVIWALHLWAIALPALLLLLLVRVVADDYAPDYGTTTALTLGLGTLVLPFSTLFFAHVLSAALAFAAFAALWAERRRPDRPWLRRARRPRGGLRGDDRVHDRDRRARALAARARAASAPAPRAPLRRRRGRRRRSARRLQPLGLRLDHAPLVRGEPGRADRRRARRRRARAPRRRRDLLFSAWGLMTNTPVLALGLVGAVLLYRSGRRLEAAVLLAVPALAFLHDSALQFSPFGGQGLPRYLIYTFAFAARAARARVPAAPADDARTRGRLDVADDVDDGDEPARGVRPRLGRPPLAPGLLPERRSLRRGDRLVHDRALLRGGRGRRRRGRRSAAAADARAGRRPRRRGCSRAWAVVAILARTPDGGRHELGYVLAVVVAAALPAALLTSRRLRVQPG